MGVLDELGVKYERERRVGRFFIDFAFLDSMIALEVDGRHHDEKLVKEKDQRKTEYLEKEGWRVVRIKWSKNHADIVRQFVNQCGLSSVGRARIEPDRSLEG